MANIELSIEDRAVSDAFARVVEITGSGSPILEAFGRQLETLIRQGFDQSVDPYGAPWAPLKVRQGQPLVDSGHLRDSFTHEVEADSVVVGTNMEYAALQNFGATIKPVNAKALRFFVEGHPVFVGEVTIPPRPILPNESQGLPGSWSDDLSAIADEVIKKAIAG